MLYSRHLLAAILLGAALGGCSKEPASADLVGDDESKIEVQTLSATIGAPGGTLEGPADGPFAGFRLVIPPGALTEGTLISVEAAVDPTPLASDAQRVGPQFALLPDGLDLLLPAAVTVPFDPTLRSAWQNEDSTCRVWFRDGDGWASADQIESTADGVTIPISRLAVLAAGVRLPSLPLSCRATGTCPPPVGASGCLDGPDFCLTRLVPPKVAAYEYTAISLDDGNAYYLTSPGQNSFAVARYDLFSTNGATTVTTPLEATPTRGVSARGHIRPDPDSEDVWVSMLGYGSVRFRFGRAASRFDTATTLSPTGIVYSEAFDTLVRFTVEDSAGKRVLRGAKASGSFYDSVPVSLSDTPMNVLEVRRSGKDSAYQSELAYAGSASGVYPYGNGRDYSFRDWCGSSAALTAAFDITARQSAVGCLNRTVASNRLSAPVNPGHAIGGLAVGGTDKIYVIDPGIAQLTLIELGGGVTYLPLTSAAEGTADYNRMLPLAVRYDPSLNMLVLFTRGNNAGGVPDIFLVDELP